eukprot:SAG22_NODE_2289_length_2753_cov_11.769028_2_plen_82_part_00
MDICPRLLLGPLGGLTQEAASSAVRQRCRLFIDGNWSRLWAEMPPVLAPEARAALRKEREAAPTRLLGARFARSARHFKRN